MIKAKKQIFYILLGLLVVLSFYLILNKIIHRPIIQPPEEKEAPFEERGFVYFQTPIGKIIEEVALDKKAQEKFENIIERAKKTRDKSEKLKNLSQELKELTNNCLCGKSACQSVDCENGCCCQATGCPTINTCSKPGGCPVEVSNCNLAMTCPERDCDIEAITKKIAEIEELMAEIKIQQKEILVAQLFLLSDYIKLKKVEMMVSLPSEAIDYENFFKKRDLIENTYKQKVAITTFSTWPEPTIEVNKEAAIDPSSIYFDKRKEENEQVIKESSRLDPFLIIANQCPADLSKIMSENSKEVFSGLSFKNLTPATSEIDNIMRESIEEVRSQLAEEISKAIADILGEKITTVVIEELKGETGGRMKIGIPIDSVNQIADELPAKLSNLFAAGTKAEILTILSETDLLPSEITNLLSESLVDLLPDDLRARLALSVGETLPGDLMDLIYTTLLNELFDSQLDTRATAKGGEGRRNKLLLPSRLRLNEGSSSTSFIPEQVLNTIDSTLADFLPDRMSQALFLSLKDALVVSLKGFLVENIPQTLGFVSSDEKRLSDKIEEEIKEELPIILNEKLQNKLSLEQVNQFSLSLLEKGTLQKKTEEVLSESLFLVLRDRTEKTAEIISDRASKKIAEDIGKRITDSTSKELAEKVAEDLKEIVTSIMLKTLEEGLPLNSLHDLKSLDELENKGTREELKISYPQICQLTIPDLKETDKEDKSFEACWKVKTIYDAVSHQINTLQKMTELIQDPDKGCDPNRCQAQCLDATCYAKDFHCSSEECPNSIGLCSKYQTSYPTGPLPCKSDYIDFYNDNGSFQVCPAIHLGNELIIKYYLQIKKAGDEVQDILQKENDKKNVNLKERVRTIMARSKVLKDLSQGLKELTDKCQCSEKSLCEELSGGCLAKGCSLLSQCSQVDIQEITEKIEEIEGAIEELYYSCKK